MTSKPIISRHSEVETKSTLFKTEQSRLLYASFITTFIATAVNSLVLSYVQWSVIDSARILGWLGLLGVIYTTRVVMGNVFYRTEINTDNEAAFWLNCFRAGALASGLVWGIGGVLLFPASDVVHQVFVAFVLGGVSAGAITSLAIDRVSSMGFVTLALVPLIGSFVMRGDEIALPMGMMIAFFMTFVAVNASRIQRTLYENISLRAEVADREREYRSLAENLPDNIARWDTEGRYLYINPKHEQTLGNSLGDVLGKLIPNEHTEVKAALAQVVATGHEIRAVRQPVSVDGITELHDVSIVPEFDEAGNIVSVLGIGRDMTESYRIQNTIATSEQEFRTLAENSPDTIARYNKECQCIYANPVLVAQTDMPMEFMLGGTPSQHFSASGLAEVYNKKLRETLLSGVENEIEMTWSSLSLGKTVTSHIRIIPEKDRTGIITSALCIGRDISDRKVFERNLEENAQHTQSILDNIVDGIITINVHGIIESFSCAAETIFGYTAEETIGRSVNILMPESYRTNHNEHLKNCVTSNTSRIFMINREVDGLRKNGMTFPLEIAVSKISREGRLMFICVVRDITDRKHAEQLKNEFVSTVSHELRTPLTSIIGALGLLINNINSELPEQYQHMLDIAYKNSQRLTLLINDLLDMEKLAAGKMYFSLLSQDIMLLVDQALEDNRVYAEQHQVRFELVERTNAQVKVDAFRLQQALSNFLSNAAKFSPTGGQVDIAVRRNNNAVRVEIIDHGAGIPKEFHSRIFQKFSQADATNTRQKGGTGLGLAISKELIERMQGLVGFETKPGRTCFHFELPIVNVETKFQRSVDIEHNRPLRLLVVEDNHDIASVLAGMLLRNAYIVDVAHDGEAALSLLSQNKYDAMTLDLVLPDQNGISLIRQIRGKTEIVQLPIIVVSANTDDGRMTIDAIFPDIDWLEKPTDELSLISTIQRAVSRNHPVETALYK